jgi:DNA-binding transcriptional ArsR family regulator
VLANSREDLLRCLRAIGDPLRLRMLVLLANPPGPRCGPLVEGEPGMCVSDLRARTGRAHALVSHHIQVLLRAGLIRRIRRGRWSLLQVDTARVEALGDQIAALASDQLRALHGGGSLTALEPPHGPLGTLAPRRMLAPVPAPGPSDAPCAGASVAGARSW